MALRLSNNLVPEVVFRNLMKKNGILTCGWNKKMIHAGGLWLKQFEEKETEKY